MFIKGRENTDTKMNFGINTGINKHYQFQSWLSSRSIETFLGKMMILFIQRLLTLFFVHYLLMQASRKSAYSDHLYANAVVLMFRVS